MESLYAHMMNATQLLDGIEEASNNSGASAEVRRLIAFAVRNALVAAGCDVVEDYNPHRPGSPSQYRL